LKKPAMFTPGDNDWTDCDRTSNGPFNSLERLQHERDVLFSTDHSFGKEKMKQEVQTSPACEGWDHGTSSATTTGACVENRIWTFKKVTYVTVNVQGTCNNLCGSGSATDPAPGDVGDPAEYAARNAADNAWLQAAFDEAVAKKSAGIMVIGQADPGFDKSDGTRAPLRDPKTLDETDANSGPKDVQVVPDDLARPDDLLPEAGRATTTCTGSRRSSTRIAATCSRSRRRSCGRTAWQFRAPSCERTKSGTGLRPVPALVP
jgi:hypothetical protein